MTVLPVPTSNVAAVIRVYTSQTLSNFYNHILLKALVLAKCKQVYSSSLMKYGNIQLPGGGSVYEFGSRIRDEGLEKEKELLERFRAESDSNVGFFMLG